MSNQRTEDVFSSSSLSCLPFSLLSSIFYRCPRWHSQWDFYGDWGDLAALEYARSSCLSTISLRMGNKSTLATSPSKYHYWTCSSEASSPPAEVPPKAPPEATPCLCSQRNDVGMLSRQMGSNYASEKGLKTDWNEGIDKDDIELLPWRPTGCTTALPPRGGGLSTRRVDVFFLVNWRVCIVKVVTQAGRRAGHDMVRICISLNWAATNTCTCPKPNANQGFTVMPAYPAVSTGPRGDDG